MVLDLTSLLGQIDAAFASGLDVESIERTLTDGYAYALELEAERWRLERRLGEVAREGQTDAAEELRALGTRLTHAAVELTKLRSLLGSLHERARSVRHAASRR